MRIFSSSFFLLLWPHCVCLSLCVCNGHVSSFLLAVSFFRFLFFSLDLVGSSSSSDVQWVFLWLCITAPSSTHLLLSDHRSVKRPEPRWRYSHFHLDLLTFSLSLYFPLSFFPFPPMLAVMVFVVWVWTLLAVVVLSATLFIITSLCVANLGGDGRCRCRVVCVML